MNELAIASIPLQTWEPPDEAKSSLYAGTVFPKLRKPFFIEEKMSAKRPAPQNALDKLLQEVQEISFYVYDLLLYLDTHPGEQEATACFQQAQKRRKDLLAEFARNHYPLTTDCEGCQTAGPIPWDIPGTAPIMTIIPQDQPSCCRKGGL